MKFIFCIAIFYMGIKIKYRRSGLVLFTMIVAIFILARCMGHEHNPKPVEAALTDEPANFEEYVSSQKCAGCHKEIYNSHIKTAHYLTGQPAIEKFIKGSFQKGKNTYRYTPAILLSMEKRDSGLFQVAYYKGEEK